MLLRSLASEREGEGGFEKTHKADNISLCLVKNKVTATGPPSGQGDWSKYLPMRGRGQERNLENFFFLLPSFTSLRMEGCEVSNL